MPFSPAARAGVRSLGGNVTTRDITFAVDTLLPSIVIDQPTSSLLLPTATPYVSILYSDAQGADTATLRILVDGVDLTSRFAITPSSASATLEAVGEGPHTIVAEIRDLTGNLASATSSFFTDTIKPTLAIQAPLQGARLNTGTPQLSFTYQDPGGAAGSGVDPTRIKVLLDGVDVTSAFVLGGGEATGPPPAPLADGSHTLRVEASDRANNASFAETTFLVDTQAPVVAFEAPLDGSFTNATTPAVRISFTDPGSAGSGISLSNLRVYLTAVTANTPEVDVTSALVVGASAVTGAVPGPLAGGAYRLRVTLRDEALNTSEATTTFEVDLTPPTLEIVQPAAGAAILSGTPAFVIRYTDDRSGVAIDRFVFKVDGVDRTSRLAIAATEASGTLSPEDALTDGSHTYDVTLFDRAGNQTSAGPVTFTVDSAPPTAVLVEPLPQSFTGDNSPQIRFEFADPAPSSGLNAAATRIQIDGADRTAEFTITATGAMTTALAPQLGDGSHSVRADVEDRSGNKAFVTAQFTVDTESPVLTSEIPEEGRLIGAGAISDGRTTVTGTVTDLDPTLTATCSSATGAGIATLATGAYTCQVPVAEGLNQISVTVTDSTGHAATITRPLTVDRIAPVIQISEPTAGAFTSAQSLSVSGTVSDLAALTVTVNGQSASVTAGTGGGPSTFEATGVPVGSGPSAVFEVVATDAAGNSATASVTVRVDRNAPVVVITVPASGAYLRGGVTTVNVDVTDETATILDLNGVPGLKTGCVPQTGAPGAAEMERCSFTADIPLLAGSAVIVATAFDEAGNRGVAQVATIVDNTAPVITVTSPVSGLITNATALSVSGVVTDESPLTLTINGQEVIPGAGGAFSATITNDVIGVPFSSLEGSRGVVITATDAAGNESTTSVSVIFDRTPPALTIASPLQGAMIPTSSMSVAGTVADATAVAVTVQGSAATVTGQAWSTTLGDLSEGPLTITVRAVDAAGNESSLTRDVEVDLGPPTVAITSPAQGALTKESTAVIAYSILDRSSTSITLTRSPSGAEGLSGAEGTITLPDCPGVLPCDRTQSVDLAPGDNTFTVEATDAGGRSASASVTITRDSTPPTLDLTTPETVSRGRAGTASALATDNLSLDRLEVRMGTTVICTGLASCSATIPIPETARAGDALTVTATATDRAGNTATTSRSVRVTADGLVTGTVLNDLTSLPLAGATATLMGANTRSTTTDAQGRYNIPVADTSATLRIEKPGMTSVDRQVSVVSGVGTVPLDARLTPLAAVTTTTPVIPAINPPAVIPGATGEEAGIPGPVSLQVPEGSHRVTLLSAQGLPNLLPPGFSPLIAFNWTTEGDSGTAQASLAMPTGTASAPEGTLVRYDPEMRDWRILASGLVATEGLLAVDLAGEGSYALVVPDVTAATGPPMPIGAVGEALIGLSVAPIPATATSESRVDPAILPPTGGTATGSLRIDSPTALPSGTIVQADVEETYTLASGEEASAPKRSMDVVAYKNAPLKTAWTTAGITGASESTTCAPPTQGAEASHVCATFPITPSRTYANSGLREGKVHIDLLAGRENGRGYVGGNAALTVASGSVRLNVAAGSLPEDTAISVAAYDALSAFIPTGGGLTAMAEVSVDFAGATLLNSASLTFANVSVAAGESLVVARVDRAVDGIPRLQVVALAEVRGVDAVSLTDTGLPGVVLDGVTRTGRYVLFRLATSPAFITGSTTAGGSPVRALISTDTLPFVATSSSIGGYAIAALPGANTLTARLLGSSLIGSQQATASATSPTTADIALQGTVSQATITPASGAIGVEVNEPLTLTSPVALDPATVTTANIVLRRIPPPSCAEASPPAGLNCSATQVPLRLVLSGSGQQLSILPQGPITTPPMPALEFSTNYSLEITGLLDTVGGVVAAPATTFRTKDDIKPVYNLQALKFSFPDGDGLVTVSAPNGTFPPGTEILIINSGNGVVLGLTAGNDGQVSGTLPASTSDTLFVTVTDPFGNTTSFETSTFTNSATGETAVGPGGGTIEGPEGTSLIIPEGALDKGIPMKLEVLTPEQYDALFPNQRPAFGTRPLGSVLKIHAAEPGTFNKPVKLTFNVPPNFATTHPGADPRDAIFYILKRSALGNGTIAFEVVDHAFAVCPGDKPGTEAEPVRTCDASELRVKTASRPHPEFTGEFLADMYIMMTFDWAGAADRSALAGVVVGRVRRQVWGSEGTAGQARYEPVEGAEVVGSDAGGNALMSANVTFTKSQKDGTYTLWDTAYVGGPVKVHATVGDKTATGIGYEGNPQDVSASWGPFPALRFYPNKAHVDVLFEAVEPPPPAPDVVTVVMRDLDRSATNGLSTVGIPLRIGFTNRRRDEAVTINNLDINGMNFVVTLDPEGRFAGITQDAWTPTQAGTYLLRTTALAPIGGSIAVSTVVRIIAAGGGVDTDQTQPPRVLDQMTFPKPRAKGVQTSIFPTIAFSEPVVGVTYSTVQFTRTDSVVDGGPPPPPPTSEAFKISGVTATGEVIDDVTTAPTLPITAITIQPLYGLKYKQRYTLSLTDGIQDLDTTAGAPAPKALVPYSTTFDTFGPEQIPAEGEPASYTTSGFYVAKNEEGDPLSMWSLQHTFAGTLWVSLLTGYDITDPINVVPAPPTRIVGRPVDLVGEGTTIAVATTPGVRSMPSNVRLYDVADPAVPKEIGAASVVSSVGEGALNRITMRGNRIYAGTYKKGIQVLDVDMMKSEYQACCAASYWKMQSDLSGDGQGFNQSAVVSTIPVSSGTSLPTVFTGIKSILQGVDPLIVASGNFGLALARESDSAPLYPPTPVPPEPPTPKLGKVGVAPAPDETLEYGLALDVASVGGYDLAVVAAMSGTRQVLMTVDVTNPRVPFVRSVREIAAEGRGVVDVLVNGSVVYVSTQKTGVPASLGVEVYDISDLTAIAYLGRIAGVGGRLSIVGKLLYGATSGPFGSPIDGLGGVRIAALGTVALIEGTNPAVVVVGEGPRAAEDFKLKYRVVPSSTEVTEAHIDYVVATTTVGAPVPVTIGESGRGELPLPLGFTFRKIGDTIARPRLSLTTVEGDEVVGLPRPLKLEQPEIRLAYDDPQRADNEDAEVTDAEISADIPKVTAQVASDEWARRGQADRDAEREPTMRGVTWEALDPPATLTAGATLSNDGLFETTLNAYTQAGAIRRVRAKIQDVVLGETEDIQVDPGRASSFEFTVIHAATNAATTAFPADGRTEALLTVDLKDAFGNPVADDTPVAWEKDDGADGEFVEPLDVTTDGRVSTKYRVGFAYGPATIKVHAGNSAGSVTIQQSQIGLILTAPTTRSYHNRTPLILQAQVSSPAGPLAPGTEISWFSSTGKMIAQGSSEGTASAEWKFDETTYRERVNFWVLVGRARAQQRMAWTLDPVASNYQTQGTRVATAAPALVLQSTPASRPVLSLYPQVIAGDLTGDADVPLERADGTVEQVSVKGSATYRLVGLTPGERVRAQLGSASAPNVTPVAHYSGDDRDGISLPDLTGAHDAQVGAGVSIIQESYNGAAIQFTGQGGLTVPPDAEFAFGGGFMVQTAVRPPPSTSALGATPGAGGLIKKDSYFTLELVDVVGDLRPRFTIQTSAGPEFITGSQPLARGEWTLVTGKYQDGRIYVGQGDALESMYVSSAPQAATPTSPIEIGTTFTGALDEIKIFDLARRALSRFANGEQALSFVADATGTFESAIVSTGALAEPRVALYLGSYLGTRVAGGSEGRFSRGLVSPEWQAAGAVVSDRITGVVFARAETYYEDRAEKATTDIGYVSAVLIAATVRFVKGMVSGSGSAGDEFDLATVAGDMVASFSNPVSGAYVLLRNFANASEKLTRGNANAGDGIDIALGVTKAAIAVGSGKLQALAGLPILLKGIGKSSKAAGTMSRLALIETQIATGATGLSRIRKILDIANATQAGATLVIAVVDAFANDPESVGHLNNILEESENPPGSPLDVLTGLAEMSTEFSDVDFRHVLSAFGSTDDGNPAADVGGILRSARVNRKGLKAVAEMLRRTLIKRAVQVPGDAGSIIKRMNVSMRQAAISRTQRTNFLARIDDLFRSGVVGLEDRMKQMGSTRRDDIVGKLMKEVEDAHFLMTRHPGKPIGMQVKLLVGPGKRRDLDSAVLTELGMVKHKLGQTLEAADIIESRESASWARKYVGGFPSLPHPSKLKAGPDHRAASFQWNAIDGKTTQMLHEIAAHGRDFLAKSKFSPRLAATYTQGEVAAFKELLVAHFRSRIRLNSPVLLRYLKRDKNLDPKEYEAVVRDARDSIADWIEVVK